MTTAFEPTAKQLEAQALLAGDATHLMLFGGSRSGKTFWLVRALVMRALKAPGSSHAILRFRFNHLRQSIVEQTWPAVMGLCFPGVAAHIDRELWRARLPNDSFVWFGGLDDKERVEKVLGQEHATIYLNECSQISYDSRNVAITRLAQRVDQQIERRSGIERKPLRTRMFYDCNPPNKGHWTYRLFVMHQDPTTGRPLSNPDDYASLRMNPEDNARNLSPEYLATLRALPWREQQRFLLGEWADANPSALFNETALEKWRTVDQSLPSMVKIVVAVDPSGSGDVDNLDNDEIGIVVCGLGTDGNGYVLEDCTVKAGPATWGGVAVSAWERHLANVIVAEANFGGDMVRHVIQTARPRTPFRAVTASRGKAVRAEPIAALFETGKCRMAGDFRKLETELYGFSSSGYIGEGSPNRADAMIWGMYELFPGLVRAERRPDRQRYAIT